jgi:nitroreductase
MTHPCPISYTQERTAVITTTVSNHTRVALRRAAVRATLAPSVHNTQPWKLQVTESGQLHIYADRSRQLAVLDPTSRQLTLSCGAALFNARVTLAAEGIGVDVRRSTGGGSDPVATIVPSGDPADGSLAPLDQVLELLQINRRRFTENDVPEPVLEVLQEAAAAEGTWLHVVRDPDQRATVARLSQHADDIENLNPAYRAEQRAWTTDDGLRGDGQGLPSVATHSARNQCLVLLGTAGDAPADWLRAGESLERVLLELTRHGFVASPFTPVTEVPATRARLRSELGLVGYPHLLLRIGWAPTTPAARRRRLVDVLVEDSPA